MPVAGSSLGGGLSFAAGGEGTVACLVCGASVGNEMELNPLISELARTELGRLTMWRCVALFIICCGGSAHADQASDGKALLERNCSRCHAVAPGAESPRKEAPNLSIVLGSYPAERLQSELTEGIRPKHREMPQVRFSSDEIASIYYYLHGKMPQSEYRRSQ